MLYLCTKRPCPGITQHGINVKVEADEDKVVVVEQETYQQDEGLDLFPGSKKDNFKSFLESPYFSLKEITPR
jgi:hypothetical protein